MGANNASVTALEVAPSVGAMVARAPDVFEPTTLEEAMYLARTFHASGLLPNSVRSAEAAFTIIVIGHELGLSPMAALRSIYYFDGKTMLAAALMAGIVQKRTNICEYFALIESTDKIATYETKRRGHPAPVRMSWTYEMAEAACLLSKDNWKKFRPAMLRARVQADLARAVYQDVVGGLYDPDELDIYVSASGPPTLGASVGASFAKDPELPANASEAAPVVSGAALVKELSDRLAEAVTAKDVAAIADAISLAGRKELLSPDEKSAMVGLWKARRKTLRDAAEARKTEAPTAPASSPETPPAAKSEPRAKWNPAEQDAPPPSERVPGQEG